MNRSSTLPIHPTTGRRAVGCRKARAHAGEVGPQPIWPIAGGDGTDDGGDGDDSGSGSSGDDDADGGGTDDGGADDGDRPGGDSGDAGAGGKADDKGGDDGKANDKGDPENVDDLPGWAKKIVKDARNQAGAARDGKTAAERKHQELIDTLAKALGLKEDDTPPDPAKLAEQLTNAQGTARTAMVELAVYKAAGKHKADPDALADSRSFNDAVAKLDPAADDFNDQLSELIKEAVKANPKFKVADEGRAPSGRTGGDFDGGTGDNPPKDKSVEDYRRDRKARRNLSNKPS